MSLSTRNDYRINAENQLVSKQSGLLKGNWELSDEHELLYRVQVSNHSLSGKQFFFRGRIRDHSKNELSLELDQRQDLEGEWGQELTLKGQWQLDDHNRLRFAVSKEESKHDLLLFKGQWTINKHHHIVYSYETGELERKSRDRQTFVIKGYWSSFRKGRLYYHIGSAGTSALAVTVGAAVFEKNRIRAKLSLSGDSESDELVLKGQWRVVDGLDLGFEIGYEKGLFLPLAVKAELLLGDNRRLRLKLKEQGFTAEIRQAIFEKGDLFLRFDVDEREAFKAQLGATIRF